MTELPSDTNYLPDEVTYGFVADRIILSVGDTRYDGDRFPDGVPANGVVRFIPAQTQFYTKEEPATVLPQEIRCTIYNRNHPVAIENGYDSNLAGKLVDPAGHVGNVALVVGRYHVTYQLDTGQPHRVTIDVKTTHTNNNPLWIPEEAELKPPPTERFVVNERVYKETLAARDEVREYGEQVLEAYDTVLLPVQVQDAPPENTDVIWVNPNEPAGTASDWALRAEAAAATSESLGITVDTSVGTRVFVGDTMIYGDTGWRDVKGLLVNGWRSISSSVLLRRENSVCELRAYLARIDAVSGVFLNFLPGFGARAGGLPSMGDMAANTALTQSLLRADPGGFNIRDYEGHTGSSQYVHMIWTTEDPWPTSLPGLPA